MSLASREASENYEFWPLPTPTVGTVLEDTEHARNGERCAKIPLNGSLDIVEVRLTPTLDRPRFYRVALEAPPLPAGNLPLARLRDATNSILELFLTPTGEVKLWAPVEEKNPTGVATVTPGQYFVVEIELTIPTAGKGHLSWWVDDVEKTANWEGSFRNLGAKVWWIGNPGAITQEGDYVYVDDTDVDRQGRVGLAPTPIPPQKPRYWGAFIAETATTEGVEKAPFDPADELWNEFEADAGQPVGILHLGDPWTEEDGPTWDGYFPEGRSSEIVHNRGAILLKDLGGPAGVIQDVAAGAYDASIVKWAQAARDYGHPMFLRLWWEMNGTWFNWGRQACEGDEYVAAWQHFHKIVSAIAPNVSFVWCLNALFQGHTNPFGDEEKETDSFYPGDEYVDWVSVDGYTGQNPHKELGFRSPREVFGESYDLLQVECPGKPVMIAEVGCSEWVVKAGGPAPPKKAEWIKTLLEHMVAYEMPNIRAVVWFNWNILEGGGRIDWPIETSESAIAAFAAAVEGPHYVDPMVEDLRVGTKVPLPGEPQEFVAAATRASSGPTVPHYSHPFRIEGGVAATVEQDSVEEIEDCVDTVLHTLAGSRPGAPDFGVPDETFSQLGPNPSADPYVAAVNAAEPRAELLGEAKVEGMVKRVILKSGASA